MQKTGATPTGLPLGCSLGSLSLGELHDATGSSSSHHSVRPWLSAVSLHATGHAPVELLPLRLRLIVNYDVRRVWLLPRGAHTEILHLAHEPARCAVEDVRRNDAAAAQRALLFLRVERRARSSGGVAGASPHSSMRSAVSSSSGAAPQARCRSAPRCPPWSYSWVARVVGRARRQPAN